MTKRYDQKCTACEWAEEIWANPFENPPCPECGAATDRNWGSSGRAAAVVADEIPGGVWIRNGLVNDDGSPRKYYSHSEMRLEAKRRGLTNLVRHVPTPGTDKSDHTVRWAAADITDYNDPEIRRQRQAATAAWLGVTPEQYAEITTPSREARIALGPYNSTARIVAETVAALR